VRVGELRDAVEGKKVGRKLGRKWRGVCWWLSGFRQETVISHPAKRSRRRI
jgi:hypothetical protein